MRWMLWVLAAALVLTAGMGNAQAPAPRYALVIGNAAYRTAGWELKNPVNDARLIATRLRGLGFRVTVAENANKAQMEAAMNGFTAQLRAGGPSAVGVFYYAGHGVEHDGANLLVPVDVTARSTDELRYQAPPMQFVLRDMARAGNAVNIIILDACRNLPLPSGSRNGPAGGLADLGDVPTNVLIAYATRPGLTAPDNPGESNSVFTRVLAYALETNPNDTAVNLFSEVQAKVYEATGFQQRPEFRSGLLRAPTWRFGAVSAPTGGTTNATTLSPPSLTPQHALPVTPEQVLELRGRWIAGNERTYNRGYFMVSSLEPSGASFSRTIGLGTIVRMTDAGWRISGVSIVHGWSRRGYELDMVVTAASAHLTFLGMNWQPEWLPLADKVRASAPESEKARHDAVCTMGTKTCIRGAHRG